MYLTYYFQKIVLLISIKQSVNNHNTMKIHCVSGYILGYGDIAMARVSTLKEFTVLRRKCDKKQK